MRERVCTILCSPFPALSLPSAVSVSTTIWLSSRRDNSPSKSRHARGSSATSRRVPSSALTSGMRTRSRDHSGPRQKFASSTDATCSLTTTRSTPKSVQMKASIRSSSTTTFSTRGQNLCPDSARRRRSRRSQSMTTAAVFRRVTVAHASRALRTGMKSRRGSGKRALQRARALAATIQRIIRARITEE